MKNQTNSRLDAMPDAARSGFLPDALMWLLAHITAKPEGRGVGVFLLLGVWFDVWLDAPMFEV